jgi:peptide-methionine (S)-S-oxide reductase
LKKHVISLISTFQPIFFLSALLLILIASPQARGSLAVTHQKATFAAGCFWGVEAAFEKIPGVYSATSGYTGGNAKNPTYKQVCSGTTGHAEAVEVDYNPSKVTYDQLLNVFWNEHDPTADGSYHGGQYRSAIFYHDHDQEVAAKASKEKLEKKLRKTIQTQILPAPKFWMAEDYHQDYHKKNGGICH